MLRNRSRAVTKQSPIMTDHQPSSLSPGNTQNPTRSISSFLGSPRFFNGFFSPKTISPTTILNTNNQIFNFGANPFRFSKTPEKPTKIFSKFKHKSEKADSEGIALALDLLQDNHNDNIIYNKPKSNLKIQVPLLDPYPNGSPDSHGDFGIKTKNPHLSDDPTPTGFGSPKFCTGPLSLKEMELSEEYTRVICHGPNPKTTHIYDNCVVNSCCDNWVGSEPPLQSILSFCQTCKKNIGDGSDIFMYRGEKAFCSEECRCQEMVLDGLMNY
ncbi:FCS-Like Zinc finger 8-like [Rutidosis leptorrhynchoides]|uniref:FCS-Like Zinc finger 8-like n=1 Tax=Rutidosis leptorrhynchoides TaxID=125765 RepID=UPI003A9A2830